LNGGHKFWLTYIHQKAADKWQQNDKLRRNLPEFPINERIAKQIISIETLR
jgi:hypothetical protein